MTLPEFLAAASTSPQTFGLSQFDWSCFKAIIKSWENTAPWIPTKDAKKSRAAHVQHCGSLASAEVRLSTGKPGGSIIHAGAIALRLTVTIVLVLLTTAASAPPRIRTGLAYWAPPELQDAEFPLLPQPKLQDVVLPTTTAPHILVERPSTLAQADNGLPGIAEFLARFINHLPDQFSIAINGAADTAAARCTALRAASTVRLTWQCYNGAYLLRATAPGTEYEIVAVDSTGSGSLECAPFTSAPTVKCFGLVYHCPPSMTRDQIAAAVQQTSTSTIALNPITVDLCFRRYDPIAVWNTIFRARGLTATERAFLVLRTRVGYLNATVFTCGAVVVGGVDQPSVSRDGYYHGISLSSDECVLNPSSLPYETSSVSAFVPREWAAVSASAMKGVAADLSRDVYVSFGGVRKESGVQRARASMTFFTPRLIDLAPSDAPVFDLQGSAKPKLLRDITLVVGLSTFGCALRFGPGERGYLLGFGKSVMLPTGTTRPLMSWPLKLTPTSDDVCRVSLGAAKSLRAITSAPLACVSESSQVSIRFSWRSYIGIRSSGASDSLTNALDALTFTNIAGFAFLPTVYVICATMIPFFELLTDRFRADLYYRVLFATFAVIAFAAIQLEIFDDVASFDEIGDLTILGAAFMVWRGLRTCYHQKAHPVELAMLVAIHMLCGSAFYSQDPLLGTFSVIGAASLFIDWLVTSARAARHLQDAGVSGSDLLGLLVAVVESRGDERYVNFASTVVEVIRALSGLPRAGTPPGVIQQQTGEWVDFAERHLLTEYLVAYRGNEVVLHDAAMNTGVPADAPLPALHEEDDHLRARRERYNRLRQTPPLLQQIRARPAEPVDPRAHRLEWTGAVVGQVHDYYVAGYHTTAVVPLLRACVAERSFEEYSRRAHAYIREASNQLGTFEGPMNVSPENMATWVQQMEQRLWEAFVIHGLDLHGDVFWSDSSSSGSITGDENSLMQRPKDKWMKKTDDGRRRRRSRTAGRSGTRPERAEASREPPRCTRETRNLAAVAAAARHRAHVDSRPRPAQKARPAPKAPECPPPRAHGQSEARASGSNDRASRASGSEGDGVDATPINLEMATDTWMLALGPEHTMANLAATYQDHRLADRQMLMLAIHRVALALLAAMGEAVQQAVQEARDRGMVTVRVDRGP